jgi:predicted methyltransferase
MTGQIYREAFKKLKPGGYIEILDFDDHRGSTLAASYCGRGQASRGMLLS